jgi:hypothetical protein
MRLMKILMIFVIALFMVDCLVTSIHPLYTEKDIVFMPELLGTWEGEDDEADLWIFEQSGKNAYELTIKESSESEGIQEYEEIGVYDSHLVKLGKYLFMDLYPDETKIEECEDEIHLVPTHSIWRIWIEKDVMRLAWLANDWLEKMIDGNKVNIAHVRLDDRVVLTAPTKELQKFVLKYAEDTDAFPEPGEMHRKKQE